MASDLLHEILSLASHELRGPLGVVRGYLRLLSQGQTLEPRAQKAADEAGKATERLVGLLDDLSLVAKWGRGDVSLVRATVSMRSVLTKAAEGAALPEDPEVQVNVGAVEDLMAEVDQAQLQNAIAALLHAVVRAQALPTTVDLTLERSTWRGRRAAAVLIAPRTLASGRADDRTLDLGRGGVGFSVALADAVLRAHGGIAKERWLNGKWAGYLLRIPLGRSKATGRRASATVTLLLCAALTLAMGGVSAAQVRLSDASDRTAFRAWFTLLADLQFDQPAAEVTDCAALVRFAFREALRPHTPEWLRHAALPFTPRFPDVRSAPQANAGGWPLFRVSNGPVPTYAEFADARTIVGLNATLVGRNAAIAQPGDLLYFRQPDQRQPDHLMVIVGRSLFEADGDDWVVYHTGPSDEGPGEVRKVPLATLSRHPAPRWRPLAANPHFVGVFRLALL